MKLEQIKDPARITLLIQNQPVLVEQNTNGDITRLTFGDPKKPALIVEKADSYGAFLSCRGLQIITKWRSTTTFMGQPIIHVADTEAELLKWEQEVSKNANTIFTFEHTQELVTE
jgi:hypothetical protein